MNLRVLATVLATTFTMVAIANAGGIRCGDSKKASKASHESAPGSATVVTVKPTEAVASTTVKPTEAATSATVKPNNAGTTDAVKPVTAAETTANASEEHCSEAKMTKASATDKASCCANKSMKSSMTSVNDAATTAPKVVSGSAVDAPASVAPVVEVQKQK